MPKEIKKAPLGRAKDLTGKKFENWVVIEYAGKKYGNAYWRVRCSCGREKIVEGRALIGGQSRSCGRHQRKWKHKGVFQAPSGGWRAQICLHVGSYETEDEAVQARDAFVAKYGLEEVREWKR